MKLSREEYLGEKRKCVLEAIELSNCDVSEYEKEITMRCVEQNFRFYRQKYNLESTGNILCYAVAVFLRGYLNFSRPPVIREIFGMVLDDVRWTTMHLLEHRLCLEKRMKCLEALVTSS